MDLGTTRVMMKELSTAGMCRCSPCLLYNYVAEFKLLDHRLEATCTHVH